MPGRISCPTLVGREGEFQRVTGLLDDASGTHPLILIAGEAGIGKSRLLGAIVARQRARGSVVLSGACIPIAGRSLPYGPVLDALRPRRDAPDSVVQTALRRDLRAALKGAVTGGGGRDGADHAGQVEIFEAVIEALERASEQAELVVSIEDLHWSDAATRDLLAFLVPSRWSGRVKLVATVRTDESHDGLRPLLSELDRSRQVTRVDLEPLAPPAVRDVIAGILGEEPPDQLVEEVARRSGGNPFFVEELVAAARGGDARLPPNLGEILLARVASLPEPVQQVLRFMAVIGERTPEGLLSALVQATPSELNMRLRTAIDAHVIHADGRDRFVFRHALVREALYADLLPRERRTMHEQVARALSEADGIKLLPAAERTIAMALHWDEAGVVEHALPALVEAAAVATSSHAYADAVALYRRCIARWHEQPAEAVSLGPELVMLYEYAADAAYLADDTEAAIELCRRAIALHDATAEPMRSAILHQRLCEFLWQHGLESESIDTSRTAFELAPADGSRERAIVVGAWASALSVLSRYEDALQVVEEAVEIGRRLDDAAATSWSLAVQGLSRCNLGDMERGLADLAEARELARRSGDVDAQAIVYMDASWIIGILENDTAKALDMIREWGELVHHAGLERSRGMWMSGVHGALEVRRGNWDAAAEILRDGLRRPSRGPVRLEVLYNAALLAIWQARFDEAVELVAEAREIVAKMIGQQMIAPNYAAAMELELWRGDPREAIRLLEEARSRLLDPDDPLWTRSLYAAGARAYADEAERLRGTRAGPDEIQRLQACADEMERLLHYPGLPNATAQLPETRAYRAQAAAEVMRIEAAPAAAAAWRAVADSWRTLGLGGNEAYARLREAGAWLAGDDRSAAAGALERGHAVAVRLGAKAISDALERLAGRARVRLSSVAATAADAPHGLTAREAEVLALLARGMTNRQIAGQLYISEKTAGVHVSNILAKLDVVSRAQAAAYAVRTGVVQGGP